MWFLIEAKQQHLYLQRADWALETALHIWLIYRPFLPRVPIKPWLDITDSLMMVQTAAAVSTLSLSAEDWLHKAALPQINLRKWHKSREVFISLSLPVQSRFGVIVGKWKERHVCATWTTACSQTCGLGPQCPLLAPKSSVDPLTHIHWSSTFMRKNKISRWETVNELWKIIIQCSSQHKHTSIWYCYIRQTKKISCFYVSSLFSTYILSFFVSFLLASTFFLPFFRCSDI